MEGVGDEMVVDDPKRVGKYLSKYLNENEFCGSLSFIITNTVIFVSENKEHPVGLLFHM